MHGWMEWEALVCAIRNQHFLHNSQQVDNIVFYVTAIPESLTCGRKLECKCCATMRPTKFTLVVPFDRPYHHDRHPLSLMVSGQFDGPVRSIWNILHEITSWICAFTLLWIFVVRIGYSCRCLMWVDFGGCLAWTGTKLVHCLWFTVMWTLAMRFQSE